MLSSSMDDIMMARRDNIATVEEQNEGLKM